MDVAGAADGTVRVELRDVEGLEADAAKGCWLSEMLDVAASVDVDESLEGVCVVLVEAFEAQDAAEDAILLALSHVAWPDAAGDASAQDAVQGGVLSVLGVDAKLSCRGFA